VIPAIRGAKDVRTAVLHEIIERRLRFDGPLSDPYIAGYDAALCDLHRWVAGLAVQEAQRSDDARIDARIDALEVEIRMARAIAEEMRFVCVTPPKRKPARKSRGRR
jgi:hypothetical protein